MIQGTTFEQIDRQAADSATVGHDEADRARPASAHPAAVEFVERMGLLTQADGLPRIAGRLMGLMVLDGGPLAFGELAERLQVSRGSISTNVRLLEGMGVLERVTRPGERGDYFRLTDDPYDRLIEGVRLRAAKGATLVEATRGALAPRLDGAAAARLDALATFYATLGEAMAQLGRPS